MGFLDDAQDFFNKGIANAGRSAKSVSLKAQIADLERGRTKTMAQLGEALYALTKDKEEFRAPNESLFQAAESSTAQIEALRTELAAVELQSSIAGVPAGAGTSSGTRCARCGTPLIAGAKFCTVCGTPVPTPAEVEPAGKKCTNCGAMLGQDDLFCTECGFPVIASSATGSGARAETQSQPATEPRFKLESVPGPIAPEPELEPVEPEENHPIAELERSALEEETFVQDAPIDRKICPHCGLQVNEEAIFCRYCGARL